MKKLTVKLFVPKPVRNMPRHVSDAIRYKADMKTPPENVSADEFSENLVKIQ